ncbi:hypothetical protein LTR17_018520 [Elasticomyces elasticus]|nr:hypothetical protein LTR17_018520 [Elasticomyces elasticus]
MSKFSALPGLLAANSSYGVTPLPTSVITGYAMETTTHAGRLDSEPSTVSDDFGTSDQGPAGIIASLFSTAGAPMTKDPLHSSTPSSSLAGSLSFTHRTMTVSPILADGGRVILAAPATTESVPPRASALPETSVFAIADLTFAAGRTLPVTLGSGLVLTPGGPAVTISDQAISMATSASHLVMGSTTIWPTFVTPTAASAPITAILMIDGQTYTANSGTRFSFGPSAVLSPGGVLTVSGHTMSLDPSGYYIAVNGVTSTLTSVTRSRDLNTGEISASAVQSSMIPIVGGGSAGVAGAKAIQTTSSSCHGIRSAQCDSVSWALILIPAVLVVVCG